MTDIILKADHLKKVFISGKKSITAVDDVSFELERGECLGIVGESGSGKSTIAKMITHLESITEGQVFLKGKDITHARGKDLRETYQNIQMVFQMPMESEKPSGYSDMFLSNLLTRDVLWATELGKVSGIWG